MASTATAAISEGSGANPFSNESLKSAAKMEISSMRRARLASSSSDSRAAISSGSVGMTRIVRSGRAMNMRYDEGIGGYKDGRVETMDNLCYL